jgi:hypothetical protein
MLKIIFCPRKCVKGVKHIAFNLVKFYSYIVNSKCDLLSISITSLLMDV